MLKETLIKVKSFGQKRPKIWNTVVAKRQTLGDLVLPILKPCQFQGGAGRYWEIQVQILSMVSGFA